MTEPWQLQLFRRSLKKRQTVDAHAGASAAGAGRLCLELGCGTGLTSHFLRQRGGTWVSADFERDHVRSARQLVGDRVLQIGDAELPFASASFDVVAAINFLEHIEDDETFFARDGARAQARRRLPVHGAQGRARAARVRAQAGAGLHGRPGRASATRGTAIRPPPRARSWSGMASRVRGQDDYCRFFTESLEDLLNFAYHRKAMKEKRHRGAGLPRRHRADVGRGAEQGGHRLQGVLRGLSRAPRVDHARPPDSVLRRAT